MKFRTRLIIVAIFGVVMFFFFVSSQLPLLPAFFITVIGSGGMMLLLDPKVRKWMKEREEKANRRRREREQNMSTYEREYQKHKARLHAKEDFEEYDSPRGGRAGFESGFGPSSYSSSEVFGFGSKKKRR